MVFARVYHVRIIPQNWLNNWLFHQKIPGVTVLAHVDSCRKMDLKEVSEVEVPWVEKGVDFW